MRGGYTNAKSALDMCRDLIFTNSNGDRADATNVVVLLTDGCSTVDNELTQPAAQSLKDAGVIFFAVAIGDVVDLAEMELLATNNDFPYFLRVQLQDQIRTTVDDFLQSICEE